MIDFYVLVEGGGRGGGFPETFSYFFPRELFRKPSTPSTTLHHPHSAWIFCSSPSFATLHNPPPSHKIFSFFLFLSTKRKRKVEKENPFTGNRKDFPLPDNLPQPSTLHAKLEALFLYNDDKRKDRDVYDRFSAGKAASVSARP